MGLRDVEHAQLAASRSNVANSVVAEPRVLEVELLERVKLAEQPELVGVGLREDERAQLVELRDPLDRRVADPRRAEAERDEVGQVVEERVPASVIFVLER